MITGNQPDILTDGSGTGNVFFANACATSVTPRRPLLTQAGSACLGAVLSTR